MAARSLLAALALPTIFLTAQTRPAFDVASIKPNKSIDRRFGIVPSPGGLVRATNTTLRQLINAAYGTPDFRITGSTGWMSTDRFDIEAKASGDPPRAQLQLMLQSLLADRFKLVVHLETKELPTYDLVVARGGPKFKEAKCVGTPSPQNPCGAYSGSATHFFARAAKIGQLTQFLSTHESRIVIDKTGLSGEYDMELTWTPVDPPLGVGDADQAPLDPNGPSIFTALQEQLGLRLEPSKGLVEILVIDSAEKPTGN
ncbi:MAG TPA: TIGR03435 family protein [Bryobacteraceae bacterium]|jgi:uncharacterized protein (TIGR03435 family)